MLTLKSVDFKIFGLQHEKNGAVRADIFAKKLGLFVNGLKAADKHLTGKRSLNYLITNLEYSSAVARISEQQISTDTPSKASSIGYYQDVVSEIRDGKKVADDVPEKVLRSIANLGNGANKSFSHGEIDLVGRSNNVIRIDDFLDRRADAILQTQFNDVDSPPAYKGIAYVEFGGVIKEVDLRGKIASAKLFLRAGNSELDCICNSVSVRNLGDALNQQVIVNAKAFYDGQNRLPERLDIKKIRILKTDSNLSKWKGAFDIPHTVQEAW